MSRATKFTPRTRCAAASAACFLMQESTVPESVITPALNGRQFAEQYLITEDPTVTNLGRLVVIAYRFS
jgi:hypothetical protein